MNILFLSNYYNHHQHELSEHLFRLTGGNFVFGETAAMDEERVSLGWGNCPRPDYVRALSEGEAKQFIADSDVVIFGSAPEKLARDAIRRGKLLLRCSERPLKRGLEPLKYLPRLVRWHWRNPVGKPIFLLAAGGGAAEDYGRFGLFRGRACRWGYFPPVRRYDGLWEKKDVGLILWAGRFLELKHPDRALRVAARLRDEGILFRMEMIGSGEMESRLRAMIAQYKLEDRVTLPGVMTPEGVRDRMEEAGIFLFTSDRREGWGAVLSEAMNGGCAVVTDEAPGAVPFLLRDGENGLIYGDEDGLYQRVKELLACPARQRELGAAACRTITEEWNARTAAERLVCLTQCLLAGENPSDLFSSGPCSPAGGAP